MGKFSNSKLKTACLAAMLTAVICVVSQFSMMTPLGVPLTFQMAAIALCGYLLGVKWSMACVLTYILIGAVGIPVFSGFKGGANVIFGPTGGYIIGFLLLAFFCGLSRKYKSEFIKGCFAFFGTLLCYIFGTIQLVILTEITFNAVFLGLQIGLLVKDILLCIAMLFVSFYIEKVIKLKRP